MLFVLTLTGVSALAMVGNSGQQGVAAPVSYSVDSAPIAVPQPQTTQEHSASETVFVGSIVTNYNGRRFEVMSDGTLAPIAD
jgi:hypothetical protein